MSTNLADYKNIWVFAEQRQGKIMGVALELIGEATKLAKDIDDETKVAAVLVGNNIDHLAKECFEYGADMVYMLQDPLLENFTTDAYAKVMTEAMEEYKPDIVLYGATHIGRDLAPRIAARAHTGLTADCTHLDVSVAKYIEFAKANTTLDTSTLDPNSPDKGLKMTRPAFGGNLMATILCPFTFPQIGTCRPGVNKKLEPDYSRTAEIEKIDFVFPAEQIRIKLIETITEEGEKVDLEGAEIIVSGGRGLGGPEGFETTIKPLADALGGVVGSSRAAVDAGWIPHSHQVGQTGKTVGPKLYVACGISGAIQHLAGMSGSDFIVCINKDVEAPIFGVADLGVIGNLYDVVPALTKLVLADKD